MGTSTVLPTAEEHNDRRRRAKATRRRNHGKGNKSTTMGSLDKDIREDRRNRGLMLREQQSDTALTLLDPSLDGIARKVAELVITNFSTVSRTPDKGYTLVAEEQMLTELSVQERTCTGAVRMGKERARRALTEAYNKINADTSA